MIQEKTKEVQVLEKEISKELAVAESIKITTLAELSSAAEIRKNLKELGKKVKEEKEKATKPLKEVLDAVKSWFGPIEDNYEQAEKLISSKIIDYQDLIEKKRLAEEKKAQDKIDEENRKLEAGEITEEQAEKKIEKVETKLEKVEEVTTKNSDFHTRVIKKVRITNESLLPRIYLVPNEVKIRKDVLNGVEVPGAEMYDEKTIV